MNAACLASGNGCAFFAILIPRRERPKGECDDIVVIASMSVEALHYINGPSNIALSVGKMHRVKTAAGGLRK